MCCTCMRVTCAGGQWSRVCNRTATPAAPPAETPAVTRRGGMVNKFTGDGMLAVFGVPVLQDPAAEAAAALEAAREIQAGLEQLNAELSQQDAPAMRVRAGIHSGEALVGSMGSAERIEYAVIGDTVNCASRLESLDKHRHQGVMRVLVSNLSLIHI